jgi:Zn finger protein HypA/HybF involved in hydrogenase expression
MAMLLSVLIGAGVLIAYYLIEKRINQRACTECGFTMSLDAIEEQCPNCDALLGGINSPPVGKKKRKGPPSRLGY